MNKQKEYIKQLKSVSISPLFGAINYFNQKQQKWVPGKREDLNKREIWDHITVPSNAIHYDLDARSYSANHKIAKKIIEVLKSRGWAYNIYCSSKKGIHIETFFDKPEFDNNNTKKLFTTAMSYNLSFKNIRIWLWNLILDEAGINRNLRGSGNGKILDTNCINFDDLQDKNRLLRVCGGCKKYYDKQLEEEVIYYKTWINPEEFTRKSSNVKALIDVIYPTSINLFKFNEYEFAEFLNSFIEQSKNDSVKQLEKIDLTNEGGYINLDTVRRVREGLGRGQRSTGAQILAIAMSNDNIPLIEQETIMKDYVSKCEQIGEPFTISEAMQWVKWVKTQPNIFWNCGLAESAGLHEAGLCDFCKKQNKEAYAFLKDKTLLKQIKNVLDTEIVGESDTKMLMFLLCLSKDFPSSTGRPEWNITSDPMSQNIIISSDSSSGKTYMTKRIIKLFGEKNKDYYVISRITKNAINYLTDVNMDGKIIFIEELQGMDEATSQLRVWMSEGELTLKTVEKVPSEEGIEVNTSVDKTTTGQPVFISNQAEGAIEGQLNNRSWVLGMDTTTIQTGKILDYQDKINQGHNNNSDIELRKIKDALKQLKKYHFMIPYANRKAMNMPTNDIRSRRDYAKFITLIKCSAYLHQKQRYILKDDKGREYIICNFEDYDIAKEYSHKILGATFSGLEVNQIDILNHIRNSTWKKAFFITELMREIGKSQRHWWGQLNQLVDLGFLTMKKIKGQSTEYAINDSKIETVIKLPNVPSLKSATKKSTMAFFEKSKLLISQIPDGGDISFLAKPFISRLKMLYNDNAELDTSELEENGKKVAPSKTVQKCYLNTSMPDNTLNVKQIDSELLGAISRTNVIEYMKKCNNSIIPEHQILKKFKGTNIEEILKMLLDEIVISKYRANYILL